MKKLTAYLLSFIIILSNLSCNVFAETTLTYQEITNSKEILRTMIQAKDITENKETGEINFKNVNPEDTNTYLINEKTIYPENKSEVFMDINDFLSGDATWIALCIQETKYYPFSKRQNEIIHVPVVIAFSSNIAGIGEDSKEDKDEKYDVLRFLDIMIGDENGNLNLESYVTRAEMSQLIINMLNLKKATISVDDRFVDVQEDYWAYNAIHLSKQMRYIQGFGNNMFKPEDNVTFEQAIKMLVNILGYNSLAEEKGGYPLGYIKTAEVIGLTENITFEEKAYAKRRDIADLLMTIMYLPVMEQVGYGDEPEYIIMNGENGNPYLRFYDVYIDYEMNY